MRKTEWVFGWNGGEFVRSIINEDGSPIACETLGGLQYLIFYAGTPPPWTQETVEKAWNFYNTPLEQNPCATCTHKWREYVGIMDRFEYCEICDEKRPWK